MVKLASVLWVVSLAALAGLSLLVAGILRLGFLALVALWGPNGKLARGRVGGRS